MRPLTLATCLLVAFAFASPANADHGCNGTITELELGSETLYLDDRGTAAGTVDLWLYVESNGIDGFQSGGDVMPLEDGIFFAIIWDPCLHSNPDTLIV